MAFYGDEKHNENEERIDSSKSYTVTLTFECVDGESPLDAAKRVLGWLEKGADDLMYEVEDEDSGEAFYVDLSVDTVTERFV